ncbi:hypothetical protein RND71_039122 [Anisodus tanguticus]|uniref:non-specific serine/threonine protein kinase n=1 Tax=Anisodus tanguticus TaxID=243964 RepID=A0AAE1QWP8_9SOLA|nr:hypothetical protein RND71_039122 [Anisodus tanguticus]
MIYSSGIYYLQVVISERQMQLLAIVILRTTEDVECYLNGNKLRGSIPEPFKNLKNLLDLYLCKNFFNQTIPQKLGSLPSLEYLDLGNNFLTGKIPVELGNIKSLIGLYLSDNQLSDVLPVQLGNLENLDELYLQNNEFSGSLPPSFKSLKKLTYLTLRNCSIVDRIPDRIWNLSRLQYLDLSFNSLFGGIPEAVNHSLNYIFLRRNKLNETIPAWMNATLYVVAKQDQVDFLCKNGTQFYDRLYINCGGESVPVNGSDYEADLHPRGESTFFWSKSSNWGYSSMGNFLWASRNKYTLNETCQIHAGDAQLYRSARLSPISLKYYGFCLKSGMYEVKLHFAEISTSKNKYSHSKAGRLFDVDVQGENVLRNFNIEREAGGVNKAITKRHTTYVKNSRLEIHLYWSGKGSVLYPSVYYGPLISAITVTPVQSELSPGVLAGISGFALLLLILFIELELVELYPGGLYNYRKIKAATKNFGVENRLGEGGFGTVYKPWWTESPDTCCWWEVTDIPVELVKGTLANGTAITVKKLSATKEGMYEFVEKSRTIAGMKHPNLVTLMGCCAGNNQLLLIYEYIGTNSLEDALFGSDELRARLDWPTRYRICLGLAEGLAFLHEGSKQEIIHGDIKPANIILDDDLNPKIYDFGFARLYHKQKSEGTMSYTAPEVKDRPLEARADVYSFGVVTLILVSGMKVKTPRAGGDTEYLVDEYYSSHEPRLYWNWELLEEPKWAQA